MSLLSHPDVDRGWAWVVLVAVAIQQMLSSLIYMTGLFNVSFLNEYQLDKSATAMVGALHSGIFCCTGPVSSMMLASIGARKTVFIGTFLTMAGFFLAAFSSSFLIMCLTYGVIAGVGLSFSYLPGLVMIGLYFDRYRNIAFGIVTMSVGIGQIWLAPLISYLIMEFGWRGTMIILSGINAHGAIAGTVLRPIIQYATKNTFATDVAIKASHSIKSTTSPQPNPPFIGKDRKLDESSNSLITKQDRLASPVRQSPDKFHSSASIYIKNASPNQKHRIDMPISHSSCHLNVIKNSNNGVAFNPSLSRVFNDHSILAKMSSDYICRSFSSINSIANYKTESNAIDADKNIENDGEKQRHKSDFKDIMKNFRFIMFFISLFIVALGQSCVYLHLPAYSISLGTSSTKAAMLVSSMGLANIIARLFSGAVTNIGYCTSLMVYNTSLILCGFILILLPSLTTSYATQLFFATAFSFLGNCYCAIQTPLTIDMVGLQPLGTAAGVLLFGAGVGFLGGPPIAGLLFDLTGSYNPTFYLAGISVTLAVGFMIPMSLFSVSQKSRLAEKEDTTVA